MTEPLNEPQITRELYNDIISRRGGAERFSPEQLRVTHALVIALAKPAEIDPPLVEKLVSLLPPLSRPVPQSPTLNVRFVSSPMRPTEERLRNEIAELQRQLEQARANAGIPLVERGVSNHSAEEITRVGPSYSQQTACGEPSNVVPFAHEAIPGMSKLVECNRAFSNSPYLPVDRFDSSGRRLDENGLPASRKQP
jgi:hypothetical protein